MSEFLIPRNEKELCELFEDLLLMKTEKFVGYETKNDQLIKLTDKDLNLLCKVGIVNRIFRRWFQLTWGYRNWSRHFEGETPRQELSHCYSDFADGNAMLSVDLARVDSAWKIIPHLFLKESLLANSGAFMFGLDKIQQGKQDITAPNFDPGFKVFSKYMLRLEKTAQTVKSYNPSKYAEEKWWRLFWLQTGASLIFNIRLDLSHSRLLALSGMFQRRLNDFASGQGNGVDDFIEIDTLFFYLWNILTKNDKKLLSYDTMVEQDTEGMQKRSSGKDYLYSVRVFYHLGHAFDELVLFPADRYFGGVEIVWTDQENFMGAMTSTISLLKNKLTIPLPDSLGKEDREKQNEFDYMGIEETAFNIKRLWFAPPTSFRFLPSIKRYF